MKPNVLGELRELSMKYFLFTCTLALVCLSSCSHGFNRQEMRRELERQTSYRVQVDEDGPVTAESIRAARALRPQLRFPFSLAIYEAAGCGVTAGFKDEFLKAADSLRSRGVVSQVAYISPLLAKKDELKSVRLAAAKQGADAVFYYRCAESKDSYLNPFSLFYLTIFGFWIAPGNSIDYLVMLQGAMFDVGNEYVYLTVEAEGEGNTYGPAATIEQKPAYDRAKQKALAAFSSEFERRVSSLR